MKGRIHTPSMARRAVAEALADPPPSSQSVMTMLRKILKQPLNVKGFLQNPQSARTPIFPSVLRILQRCSRHIDLSFLAGGPFLD